MGKVLKYRSITLVLLCFCCLSACGQKRPLYLPEEPTQNSPAADDEQTTSSSEKGNN